MSTRNNGEKANSFVSEIGNYRGVISARILQRTNVVRICATACVTTCGECQGLDC